MKKRYTQDMLDIMKSGQEKTENNVVLTYKRIPETTESGAVDPRTLTNLKKMRFMMKFIPKKNREAMFNDITGLRKMFNGIKSIPVTREDMHIEKLNISNNDNNIPIRIYLPNVEAKNLPVLYYIHGGGFFAGSTDVVEQACKMITDMHPCITVSVNYRLAPENPFPAGFDDCWYVLEWIYKNINKFGGDPDRIAISGDSAGGNFSLNCALRNRDKKTGMIKLLIPFYPLVNLIGTEDEFYKKISMDMFEIGEKYKKYVNPMMMNNLNSGLNKLLGTDESTQSLLSPYLNDMTGMPPTLIVVGEHDFLMPDCKALAAKMVKSGVSVRTVIYRGIGHAFLDKIGIVPQAEDSLIEVSKAMTQWLVVLPFKNED